MAFLLPDAAPVCCDGDEVVDRFGFTVCAVCGRSRSWSPDDVDTCVFGTVEDTRAWVSSVLRAHRASSTPARYR